MIWREARAADAHRVAEFDRVVFGVDAWPEAVWRETLEVAKGTETAGGTESVIARYIVVEDDPEPLRSQGRLAAVGGVRLGVDAEILTIGVRKDLRGRGLGRELLARLLKHAKSAGAENVFLEVRSNGVAAQQLYRSFGFEDVGRRRRYYADDDAIIMRLDLTGGDE